MRCRIHRGCHEIGGNCIELEFHGQRIVLDLGLPLEREEAAQLPDIPGLSKPDESLLGVFITHPHPDHYGLAERIRTRVPVYMGKVAQRLLTATKDFTNLPTMGSANLAFLEDRKTIQLGPFRITGMQIDHSATDSYSLLVEAGGKRLFYTGDLRGHGRRSHLFRALLSESVPQVDVMICEGTQLGQIRHFEFPHETAVENRLLEIFEETKGVCLVWLSSQNIDRLISVWNAARRASRSLILDVYTAEIIRAVQHPSLPKLGRDPVRVFLPPSQRRRIIEQKRFEIVNRYHNYRIFEDQLPSVASRSVMIFRRDLLSTLGNRNCLDDAVLITSLWSGYVRSDRELGGKLRELGIRHEHVHTSGHATPEELQELLRRFPAKRIVPVHLQDCEAFAKMSPKVELKDDGEWWEV